MLCTKYIIVYFLGNNFPIVLAGEALYPRSWLRHYTSPDNTIGKVISGVNNNRIIFGITTPSYRETYRWGTCSASKI